MRDAFGRNITYLRVSVTDRCDFRCHYCMAENMTFLPRPELLTFEELDRICSTFIERGVTKLRLTGGEPLVRKGVMTLFRSLSRHLKSGALKELTLTSNGSQLAKYADELADCGVKRINVSVDSMRPDVFAEITRRGKLDVVLNGIQAAKRAGLKVKLNAVALKGQTEEDIYPMLDYCAEHGFDMTFIETMPLGEISTSRLDHFLPLTDVRKIIEERWTIHDIDHSTGGPARYVRVEETGNKIGFISPLTHGFCETCNRMRLTCVGKLYMCLGQNDHVDLRDSVRLSEGNEVLNQTIDKALEFKPKGHDFMIDEDNQGPAVDRFMSHTGG